MPVMKREKEQGGAFRVMVGEHLDNGPAGCECDGCYADDPKMRGKNHRYVQGEIVESPNVDLEKRFNKTNSIKFRRVSADEARAAIPQPAPAQTAKK